MFIRMPPDLSCNRNRTKCRFGVAWLACLPLLLGSPFVLGQTPDSVSSSESGVHWAYRPPLRSVPKEALESRQSDALSARRSAIDGFIQNRLEELELSTGTRIRPAPEADRSVLFRRLSLDLTGLPPEPDAVEAFVADSQPDAYERWVDRLLASP